MGSVSLLPSLGGSTSCFYSSTPASLHSPIHGLSVSLRAETPGIYLDFYLEFVDGIQGVHELGWKKYILFFSAFFGW